MSHPGNSVLAGYEPFPELLPADPYGSHNPHPCDNHSVFSHSDHPLNASLFWPNYQGGGTLHGTSPTLPLPEKALKEISERFGIPIAVRPPPPADGQGET